MKKLAFLFLIVLSVTVLFSGCSKKAVTKGPEPQIETVPVQKETVQEGPKAQEQLTTRRTEPDTIIETQRQKAQMADSGGALAELQSRLQDIHFDFDKYDIREDAKPALKEVSETLQKNRSVKVIIEGHCDERGTNEYNLGLGDRRANATKEYLHSLGIPAGKIETVSYGEEKPLCTEATEECWAKNRRAHFVLVGEKK